jgi:hypothetical protein
MLFGIGRGVVFCALSDPAADQLHLVFSQRRFALRHLRFAVHRSDLLDEGTLFLVTTHGRAGGF